MAEGGHRRAAAPWRKVSPLEISRKSCCASNEKSSLGSQPGGEGGGDGMDRSRVEGIRVGPPRGRVHGLRRHGGAGSGREHGPVPARGVLRVCLGRQVLVQPQMGRRGPWRPARPEPEGTDRVRQVAPGRGRVRDEAGCRPSGRLGFCPEAGLLLLNRAGGR